MRCPQDVSAALADLAAAYDALAETSDPGPTPEDPRTELATLIGKMSGVVNDNYTEESWNAFQAQLQAALALDINAATDAEVQAMIDALNAAYAGLTKNPSEPGGPTDPTSPDGNTGSGNAGGGNAGSGNGAVQTGDAAAPAGLLAVLVISGGVVTVLARRKRMR